MDIKQYKKIIILMLLCLMSILSIWQFANIDHYKKTAQSLDATFASKLRAVSVYLDKVNIENERSYRVVVFSIGECKALGDQSSSYDANTQLRGAISGLYLFLLEFNIKEYTNHMFDHLKSQLYIVSKDIYNEKESTKLKKIVENLKQTK